MDVSKSIDFLLEKAGDVIKYRLHKEILGDLSKSAEENLLEKVMLTPKYKLLESYRKANGYIGIGMHSWDKFKETPLQDGEAAARLIHNYSIPKDIPLAADFARSLTDDAILEHEFSYYNPEIARFKNRHIGTETGASLQLTIDTCVALIGYGDDDLIERTKQISYNAFISMLRLNSLDEIITYRPELKRKYNYPFVMPDTYLPCLYHLQVLANTHSWRNETSVRRLASALTHMNEIMTDDNTVTVKIGSKFSGAGWSLIRPFKPYTPNFKNAIPCHRRTLTDFAKLGIGNDYDILKISAENVLEDISGDGILRMKYANASEKRGYKSGLIWATPYSEGGLEQDYKTDISIFCDLTFWAVEFLHIYNKNP